MEPMRSGDGTPPPPLAPLRPLAFSLLFAGGRCGGDGKLSLRRRGLPSPPWPLLALLVRVRAPLLCLHLGEWGDG